MGLAYVGQITKLDKVENSDFLSQATVNCFDGGTWMGVVKTTDFKLNDGCEVYLPDAILPEIERFEFLRSKKFRIRQCRLRGAISEVLIMPLLENISFEVPWPEGYGFDITEIRGVTKYEKPIHPGLAGMAKGNFPSFITKTDEVNFQTAGRLIAALKGKPWFATMKYDGSSGTAYKKDGVLGCCSRNLELKENENSAVWILAKKYDLDVMIPDGFAIQFEMYGERIQANPLGINGLDMAVFNVIDFGNEDPTKRGYLNREQFVAFCLARMLPMVNMVATGESFDFTSDQLRELADVKYPNGYPGEGIVIRPMVEERVGQARLSFKVINLKYGK